MAPADAQPGSSVLLDEYFDREDGRFVEALRAVTSPKKLAAFVERWKRDPRPWARMQVLAYLAEPLSRPGHQVVVKRLFKHAEKQQDDELMAAFLPAFDRLVRRRRRTLQRYDWSTRRSWSEEVLVTPRNTIPQDLQRRCRNPYTGETIAIPVRLTPRMRLFSYRTRYYLRRRAWRYFRRMGFQRPEDYPRCVAAALKRYTDEDLASGESILDNWGLMQACFRRHEGVEFTSSKVRLRPEARIADLQPAPRFGELWGAPKSAPVLLSLVGQARSRLVRLWAMELLRRHHLQTLAEMHFAELLGLFDHDDGEVQQFAAEVLQGAAGLATLELSVWLRLLETRNVTALAAICDLMRKHVAAERLTLEQCLDVACAAATPAARIGLDFLKQRALTTPERRARLARLADARCAAVAGELAGFALAVVGAQDTYDRGAVLALFDSLSGEIRRVAWAWLGPPCPGWHDAVLWCRLLETPFDDIRMGLVDTLTRRADLPGADPDALEPLWCSVLLGVHRGGRQKLKAVRQVARALADDSRRADALLPVLAVAVRSVRAPERRAGLAAVVGLLAARADLADAVEAALPELELAVEEAAP